MTCWWCEPRGGLEGYYNSLGWWRQRARTGMVVVRFSLLCTDIYRAPTVCEAWNVRSGRDTEEGELGDSGTV